MEQGVKALTRVLVVDDSPLMCKILTNIVNCDPQMIVAAVANDGKEAVDLVPRLKPDIITMDMDMPVMDGLEATKQIMASHPTPILIVASTVFKVGMEKVFKAISHGALDVIDKRELELVGHKKSGEALIAKIKFLTGVRVMERPLARLRNERSVVNLKAPGKEVSDKIVAVVASTGGPRHFSRYSKNFLKISLAAS